FSYIFYWDSFFMFRGLIRTKREWLMKEMIENFIYLFNAYGVIPNFNSLAAMGRSQPPFLSSMVLDTYNGYYYAYLKKNKFLKRITGLKKHKIWLKNAFEIAKKEYETVWVDSDRVHFHSVPGWSLNRYGDRDIGYAHSSEIESGWDFTSRFYNRADQFFPVDLNVYLYKYERDFAKIASLLGKTHEQKKWHEIASKRRESINEYMWDEKQGFFFDYDYVHEKRSEFRSLAGFTPLWAGLATEEQAQKITKNLSHFETKYGLTITDDNSLAPTIQVADLPSAYGIAVQSLLRPKQWDYPNSWPPMEYLTVIGLLKYGNVTDAARIMKKYIATHAALFRKYNTFHEKINGVTGERSGTYAYTQQLGFGWTNAIFYRFTLLLDSIDSNEQIYSEPKSPQPPYRLALPH
ncbi:MAG: trehalase family glycosidase, partial [bacterium]|nr:trehalase family glycosidase [bacterium]